MVASLWWIKSDGTEEELIVDHDFGVEGKTPHAPIVDGADASGHLEKSDNYLELRIKTPPDSMNDWRFILDYDVEGYDPY